MVVEILERTSGKPVLQFMSERVFAPLGMHDTRGTDLIAIVPNRANSYIYKDNTVVITIRGSCRADCAGCGDFVQRIPRLK